jgi:glutamyl-tRNA synthetase
MTNKIRTRIAPSPTSADKTLHLGNVRTALFAYLVAKKTGGDFILRIEDSDVARNVEGCAEGMLDDLRWLGITPNEGFGTNNQPYGPYSQLERLTRYREMVEHLMHKGLAYKCICSEELLNKQREAALAKDSKSPFRYPGTCRALNKDPDKDYVVRFKSSTDGETIHDDLVFGRIVYPHKENQDWVLLRNSGVPLYNFAVVADDIDHRCNWVIRGRDHSGPNTLIQMLLYKAFDAPIPKFAHLPMMNNQSGAKLSKRDGAVSVKSCRALGYSPGSILNYLSKFGWGHGNKELFSLKELVELFDISNCGRNDGRFDPVKFATINYEHLKSTDLTSNEMYATFTIPFLEERGLNVHFEHLLSLIPIVRYKCKTFIEAANELDPMIRKEITIDARAKELLTPEVKPKLQDYSTFLSSLNSWTEDTLRSETQHWLTQSHLTMKDIGQPVRASVFGRTQSPEIFKVMAALGKDMTIHRLNAAI